MNAFNNELTHYGVLGMKWGVRHDKPKFAAGEKTRIARRLSQERKNEANNSKVRMGELIRKADNIAKKHNYFSDSSDPKVKKAAEQYNSILREHDTLKKTYKKSAKVKGYENAVKKYGKAKVDAVKRDTNIKAALSIATITAMSAASVYLSVLENRAMSAQTEYIKAMADYIRNIKV